MFPVLIAFLILVELTEIASISFTEICSTSKPYLAPYKIKSSILAERLTAAGCEKLNLLVVNNNAHVVPFYESLGFSIDDNLFMARWLREL